MTARRQNQPGPEIDAIRPTDVPALITLALDAGLSAWSTNDYEEEAKRSDSIMLACRSGDSLIGFIVGRLIPGHLKGTDAEIYNIGVRPSFRQMGIGQLLMQNFVSQCVNHSARVLWLDVRESNESALRFYKAFGFTEAYRRPNFYSDPAEGAIVMNLDLSYPEGKF